ncbi:MAG: hypothetical protein AAF962_26455 [Actinomycetota bacterium]
MAAPSPPSPSTSDDAGSGPSVGGVELLGCEEEQQPERTARRLSARWQRRLRRGGLLAVVVYGVAVLLVSIVSQGRAEVHPVEVRLGDPFDAEWVALQGEDGTVSEGRPPPMASLGPVCVGFGRLDWPAEKRAPSVAHCVEPSSLIGFESDELIVMREVVAGDSTWLLLLFGGEMEPTPEALMVELAGDASGTTTTEVRRSGSYAAILVPNERRNDLRLEWTVAGDGRSSCRLTAGAEPGQWACR